MTVVLRRQESEKMEHGENKMQISEEGLSIIKKFEGCELESYLCPAGVWTIGYGHTKGVKEGDKINKEEAEYLLQEEMIEYESYVNDYVEVPLVLGGPTRRNLVALVAGVGVVAARDAPTAPRFPHVSLTRTSCMKSFVVPASVS